MRYLLFIASLVITPCVFADFHTLTDEIAGKHVQGSKMITLNVGAEARTDDWTVRKMKIKIAYELTCIGYPEKFEHSMESVVFERESLTGIFAATFDIGHLTDGITRANGYAMTSAWNWLLINKGKTVDCKVRYQSIAGFDSWGISVSIGGGLPITATFTDASKNAMTTVRSDEIIMYSPFTAGNGGGDSGSGDYSCAVQDGNCGDSPLIIDLAQNGIHFGEAGTGVWFDINNVGELTPIQWVKINGDEAFLVRDLNNNGQIDDGGELFGTGTFMLQSAEIGQQDNERAANGFVALAQYDQVALGGNDDGYITVADAIWQQLALWRDSNADAFTDVDEIISLEQVGISHLEIIPKLSDRSDSVGNRMPFWSWVLDKTEQKHKRYKMVDVFFKRLHSPY